MNNIKEQLKQEYSSTLDKIFNRVSSVEEMQDTVNLMKLIPTMLDLQNQKALAYGRSYAKHGEFSIFFNLDRKYDRIENYMKSKMNSKSIDKFAIPSETITDTILDMGVYSLMWAGYNFEKNPELFDSWKKNNLAVN